MCVEFASEKSVCRGEYAIAETVVIDLVDTDDADGQHGIDDTTKSQTDDYSKCSQGNIVRKIERAVDQNCTWAGYDDTARTPTATATNDYVRNEHNSKRKMKAKVDQCGEKKKTKQERSAALSTTKGVSNPFQRFCFQARHQLQNIENSEAGAVSCSCETEKADAVCSDIRTYGYSTSKAAATTSLLFRNQENHQKLQTTQNYQNQNNNHNHDKNHDRGEILAKITNAKREAVSGCKEATEPDVKEAKRQMIRKKWDSLPFLRPVPTATSTSISTLMTRLRDERARSLSSSSSSQSPSSSSSSSLSSLSEQQTAVAEVAHHKQEKERELKRFHQVGRLMQ